MNAHLILKKYGLKVKFISLKTLIRHANATILRAVVGCLQTQPPFRLAQATENKPFYELISAQVFDVHVCKIPADWHEFWEI